MQYINEIISRIKRDQVAKNTTVQNFDIKIADIGAGTGAYAIPLFREGYDVTCVEYVPYNLGRLRQNEPEIKAYKGDARKLKKMGDDEYDIVLLLGPLYHMFSDEDKLLAISEAKRIAKPGGYIIIAYLMNEYAVLLHGFRDKNILKSIETGTLDENYHCRNREEDLYDYVRLEDINRLKDASGMRRYKIISADGAADYMRRELRELSEEEFERFLEYHLSTCERPELLGAGAHTLDILVK